MKTKIIITFTLACFFTSCNQTAPKIKETAHVTDVTVPDPFIEEEDTTDYYEPDDLELGYTLTHAKRDTMNQYDLDMDSYENCNRAKKRMNIIIDSIKILYYDDPDLIVLLNKSQAAWKNYSNIMYEFWHHPDSSWGTIGPLCVNEFCRSQYDQRIRELNPWLHGSMQMNGCSGSMRILDYTYNDVLETEKRNKLRDRQDNISLTVFDTKTILKRLFDTQKINSSNEILWKPNYSERMNFPISKDGYCHTTIDTLMTYNSTHKLIVFSTTKEDYGCHICAPIISVATFSKDDKGIWNLDFFQKMFMRFGQWGETGSYGIVKLGSDFYCLKLHFYLDGGGGEYTGMESFFSIDNNFNNCTNCTEPIKQIFTYTYFYSNSDAMDDDSLIKENTDIKTTMKIIPSQKENSYYKIQLSKKQIGKTFPIQNFKFSEEQGIYFLEK